MSSYTSKFQWCLYLTSMLKEPCNKQGSEKKVDQMISLALIRDTIGEDKCLDTLPV